MFFKKVFLTGVFLCLLSPFIKAQQTMLADTLSSETVSESAPKAMTKLQLKAYQRQLRRDSVRANKNIWWSVLGGPSYTPEASFGLGGAVLMSFKTKKNDSVLKRSFLPVGINVSTNGTFVFAGAGTFFFNENKFRIYTNYAYRDEPAHYYGKGYESIEKVERSDSTTQFHKSYFQIYPRFVWEIRPNFYVGGLLDVNYLNASDINPVMEKDPYFNQFGRSYLNVGLGGLIQYDTRNDVATPTSGYLLSTNFKCYGTYLGGKYNYQILELEYRQFANIIRPRSTLAWIAKSQIGMGDVPYSELPSFGSPFDLRGYYWGKYRDKTMTYGIVEYRHMFGTVEKLKLGNFWAKCGFVAWVGGGSIGDTPFDLNKWKLNFGTGLRIQMQPGKNFRLDIGKEPGAPGVQVYMNMTEAF